MISDEALSTCVSGIASFFCLSEQKYHKRLIFTVSRYLRCIYVFLANKNQRADSVDVSSGYHATTSTRRMVALYGYESQHKPGEVSSEVMIYNNNINNNK